MKVLMIDDQNEEFLSDIVEEIIDKNHECVLRSFDDMEDCLANDEYDVIILDFKLNNNSIGGEWFSYIWEHRFFPIIFHTAFPEEVQFSLEESGIDAHPLIDIVKKGYDSGEIIINKVNEAEIVGRIFADFDTSFLDKFMQIKQDAMKYSLQCLSRDFLLSNSKKYADIINRRLANYLEKRQTSILEPFEIYIYPPINDSLMVGDIIRKKDEKKYFVILTPSCDMVDRTGVVDKVHIASLESSEIIYKATQYNTDTSVEKIVANLPKKILNNGYYNGVVPLPPLLGEFKNTMAINLKKCEYVSLNSIATFENMQNIDTNYYRVASVDSPFSEMISWAYMSISCRPGLPDRNTTEWAKSIHEEINNGS